MKEKIFYVINLDNKRITLLSIFLIGLLFSFFFLGVSIGRKRGQVQEDLSLNSHNNSTVALSSEPTQGQTPHIAANSAATQNGPREEEIKFRNLPPGSEIVDLRTNVSSTKKEDVAKISADAPSEPHKEKKLVKREKESKKSEVVSRKSVHKNEGGFYVQIAAFKGREKADELKSSIGGKSYVKKTKNGYFTVRMGNFPSREDADKSIKKLPSNLKEKAIVSKE
ncbi:SPOR domain-containing protein [Leptospira fainei]|nr:SPOR domain-containing protein [Leptospira fainei]